MFRLPVIFILCLLPVVISITTFHPTTEQVHQTLGVKQPQGIADSQYIGELGRGLIQWATKWAEEQLSFFPQSTQPTDTDYPYWQFVPAYKASAIPGSSPVAWSTDCYAMNTAVATENADGTYAFTVTVDQPTSTGCSDFYLFATVEGAMVHTFQATHNGSLSHQFHWTPVKNATASEIWDINTKGIRIFKFPGSLFDTLGSILNTAFMFAPMTTPGISADAYKRNVEFMEKYASVQMIARDGGEVIVDESLIQSGDFVGVMRLDGLDPMLAWAMGSSTGHATIAIRFDDGLYICESTSKSSYWPTNGIQRTPYQTWLKQAQAAGHMAVWAPLTDDARAQFDVNAAIKFFQTVVGTDYGYHTLLFGWLDTAEDNYPCLPPDYQTCLSHHHLEVLFGLLDRFVPAASALLFNQAINHRLNTTGLNVADLFYESAQQGIGTDVLPTIVEQDSWKYTQKHNNGSIVQAPSQVCCVFVCNMWKAGGLFSDINNDVNCGELTNWDDYALTILQSKPQRPQNCVTADPNNPLCQLTGLYALQLNDLSTKKMYPQMADSCPSKPPNYEKPANC